MKFTNTSEHVFDVQWAPSGRNVACALVTGHVEICNASSSSDAPIVASWRRHEESCRTVRYFPDGRILSCSADGSIACGKEETPTWTKKGGNGDDLVGINSLLPWDDNCFVCGDDDGLIEVYDTRISATDGPMMNFKEQSDYISAMLLGKDGLLVAGSGNMKLGVYDLRKKKLFALSDEQEDEILSMAIVKDGEKVICGGQTGTLAIFQWGDFGDQKDRIVDHPMSVDCIAKLREDIVLTGCSDGKLRVVSVYSQALGNRVVSILGNHEDNEVLAINVSPDGKDIVSCSSDNLLKFWTVDEALAPLNELLDNEKENKRAKKPKISQEESTKKMEAKAFFNDL